MFNDMGERCFIDKLKKITDIYYSQNNQNLTCIMQMDFNPKNCKGLDNYTFVIKCYSLDEEKILLKINGSYQNMMAELDKFIKEITPPIPKEIKMHGKTYRLDE